MERLAGNQLWKLRSKHGKDKIFGNADLLEDEAKLYFDWCDRHPWERVELVKYQGTAEEHDLPLGRPYSMDGLTVYLRVSSSYFRTAKRQLLEKVEANKASVEDAKIIDTIEWIETVVRTQQLEGAAVGVFNQNLIARMLGLADNVNQRNSGDPTVLRLEVRDQETADNVNKLNRLL